MKTFILTEPQMQEIAGRLDAIARGGISAVGCEHITGIHAVLTKIVAAAMEPAESNVVQINEAEAAAAEAKDLIAQIAQAKARTDAGA